MISNSIYMKYTPRIFKNFKNLHTCSSILSCLSRAASTASKNSSSLIKLFGPSYLDTRVWGESSWFKKIENTDSLGINSQRKLKNELSNISESVSTPDNTQRWTTCVLCKITSVTINSLTQYSDTYYIFTNTVLG